MRVLVLVVLVFSCACRADDAGAFVKKLKDMGSRGEKRVLLLDSCVQPGLSCTSSGDCCGASMCDGGFCTDPGMNNVPPGGSCRSSGECAGASFCDNGFCSGGSGGSTPIGGHCTSSGDCAGAGVCRNNVCQ